MIDVVEALPGTRVGNYIAGQLIKSCHYPILIMESRAGSGVKRSSRHLCLPDTSFCVLAEIQHI